MDSFLHLLSRLDVTMVALNGPLVSTRREESLSAAPANGVYLPGHEALGILTDPRLLLPNGGLRTTAIIEDKSVSGLAAATEIVVRDPGKLDTSRWPWGSPSYAGSAEATVWNESQPRRPLTLSSPTWTTRRRPIPKRLQPRESESTRKRAVLLDMP